MSAISVLTAETCDWNTKITHVYDPARVLTPADKNMIERELAKAPVPSYIAVFPNPSKEHVHDTVFGDVVRSKADECKIAQRNGRMEILLAVRPSRNRQDIETYWDVEAGGKYLWDKLTENGGHKYGTPFPVLHTDKEAPDPGFFPPLN